MSESDSKLVTLHSPANPKPTELVIHWAPPLGVELPIAAPASSSLTAFPVAKSRAKRPWQPTARQLSILSIPQELSLEKYSIELDKLESYPEKWHRKNGPKTHYEAWQAKDPWRGWLRDERRNNQRAAARHSQN